MINLPQTPGPIGIFDSGYGGLTIYSEIHRLMPQYDYMYIGDNARAPYGTRSFDVVYEFTRQAVNFLFRSGCHLVILACNTASAKALRNIQQLDLPGMDPSRRVLGIIRPTVESVGDVTKTRHVGVLATEGTIRSMSYPLEIKKLFPDIHVTGKACPMWASLVEADEHLTPGADYFVKRDVEALLAKDPMIDTIILGCTHYPMLLERVRQFVPDNIQLLTQGEAVATSLQDYLSRHTSLEQRCTKGGTTIFYTTESDERFREQASRFLRQPVYTNKITLI
ncbi:MAG: glutamate racemase [Bacteroidaceae bacterium]|nr:glutamate racemase [Bacteroidales bacterium]MBQ2877949.1 glutamate racemase [Bacteroidaceae bacterium]MBQ3187902.1 glutamate racemase [Bacteroidaceae bacterium]